MPRVMLVVISTSWKMRATVKKNNIKRPESAEAEAKATRGTSAITAPPSANNV